MQLALEPNRNAIAELCRVHHVVRLAAFGSAVRDDFDEEHSDFDLLYEFDPSLGRSFEHLLAFERDLTALLGRRVDLVSLRNVENPFRRRNMLADETLLYAA